MTKEDYFCSVIAKLIDNIIEHAYNPKNDFYGRLRQGFSKRFKIYCRDDEIRSQLILMVEDNGFGVRLEVLPHVLYGRSTKDDGGEHGIGLSAARNFVEQNGGRMWVNSVLGIKTGFGFTLPYARKLRIESDRPQFFKETFLYVQ